jgi:hypothetical protein
MASKASRSLATCEGAKVRRCEGATVRRCGGAKGAKVRGCEGCGGANGAERSARRKGFQLGQKILDRYAGISIDDW